MWLLLLVLLVLLVVGGGFGYRSGWHEGTPYAFYGGGIGLVILLLIVLFLFSGLRY